MVAANIGNDHQPTYHIVAREQAWWVVVLAFRAVVQTNAQLGAFAYHLTNPLIRLRKGGRGVEERYI